MNKTGLVKYVSDKTLVRRNDLSIIIDVFLKGIKKALESGEKVALQDFGSFYIKEKSARTALNPHTQEVIDVPAKKVVKFRMSKELKKMVNNNE
jgi:DNA-binding protein HU-beta